MKDTILFCKTCDKTFSNGGHSIELCPKCSGKLFDTKLEAVEWRQKSQEEKDILKKRWYQELRTEEDIKKAYAIESTGEYEYDVVTILNKGHGTIDKKSMINVLNDHASQGWRLHSIYSNELGKNAISLLGLGVNSTACEDVLVFERRLSHQ